MTDAYSTLKQLKRANKLVRLALETNGPKSFKKGQGELLQYLLENDGASERQLVKHLHMSRSELKDIVKKAKKNGFVTMGEAEDDAYSVWLTEDGQYLSDKRVQSNESAAKEILACLSPEEIEQLDTITDKLIASVEATGIGDDKNEATYRFYPRYGRSHRHGGKSKNK